MSDGLYSFTAIAPMLHYEDAGAMLEWLARAFGFEERARFIDRDGVVRMGEMYVGDRQEVWINGRGPGYWESVGRSPDVGVVVFVDDVDAHHARTVAAGVDAPEPRDMDWGARSYHVKDPEGYGWSFLRRLPRGYVQTKPLDEGGWKEVKAPTFRTGR